MIIFDLDGTLANCDHRRHFVDSLKAFETGDYHYEGYEEQDSPIYLIHNESGKKWEPDWQAFYEACDKDTPIEPVIEVLQRLYFENHLALGRDIQIWSGRCESVRVKTETWLHEHVWGAPSLILKMRPIGDNTPDDQLKERWLDEYITHNITEKLLLGEQFDLTEASRPIQMVFDDRPKVLRMWQRRGVFTFDVGQGRGEF